MKKVLIIQHALSVVPGFVTKFFDEENIPYEILFIFDEEKQKNVPDDETDEFSVIVSLGGPQGTYEEEKYPYLKWEKRFLGAQLKLNRPILGICLGAQILADVIGGRGHLGTKGFEAGYVDYRLTDHAENDQVFRKVFIENGQTPLFVMHHQDSFELPEQAQILAYSSNDYIAAYRFGSALCVQFHPEASFDEFSQWVQRNRTNRSEIYQKIDIDAVLQRAEQVESQAENSRRLFFRSWWNSLRFE